MAFTSASSPSHRTTGLSRPPVRQSTVIRSDVDHTFDVFVRMIGVWWPVEPLSGGKDRVRDITVERRLGGRIYESGTTPPRDGAATPLAVDASCTPGSVTVKRAATHTYAAPGAYQAVLILATVPCAGPSGGQPFVPGMIHGAEIKACAVVGPSTGTKAACPQ